MMGLQIIYAANILVAGWISWSCLFYPEKAIQSVFTGAFAYSEAIRLVGALWGAIFVLSVIGLFYPYQMSLVLLFQLIYKTSWLLFAALPAIRHGEPYPVSMASFFLIWVVILPFVIPWKVIFGLIQ